MRAISLTWLCVLGLHRWPKWSEPIFTRTRHIKAQAVDGAWIPFTPPIEITEDVQRRFCLRCGLMAARPPLSSRR